MNLLSWHVLLPPKTANAALEPIAHALACCVTAVHRIASARAESRRRGIVRAVADATMMACAAGLQLDVVGLLVGVEETFPYLSLIVALVREPGLTLALEIIWVVPLDGLAYIVR